MKKIINKQFGWRPALPDVRDYVLTMTTTAEKDSVDGRDECSPVIDQGDLGSCTGQALVYLLERLQRKMFGRHTDLSALFSYCTGRYGMEGRFATGDIGCTIRDVMKAAVKFGICPESDWNIDYDTQEIPVIAAMAAQGFKPKAYYRLDPPGVDTSEVLQNCLSLLFKGYSFIAGFSVFSSIDDGPDIPYPSVLAGTIALNDSLLGGHAIHVVGYDKNRGAGAFQIQNSWGTDWGDAGYGWLPFDYLSNGLMSDFWTAELVAAEDLGIFG